jgi:preprotein translocase subunit SecG
MSNIFLSPLALSLVGSYIVLSLTLSLLWKYKAKRLIKPEWNIEKEKDDE